MTLLGGDVLFWASIVLEVAWILGSAIYVLLERRTPAATIAWIIILAALPVVGAPIYFFIGPRRFDIRKRRFDDARKRILKQTDAHRPDELVVPAQSANLVALCENAGGLSAHCRSAEVHMYFDGEDQYASLLDAIESAQCHVHLEYYIWESDTIGTRLRDALCACAKRGVEVRVLVDAFGSPKASTAFWSPLRDAGGRVFSFNPAKVFSWRLRLLNFRTHRKIAVIDGDIGFCGGMNITDKHSKEFSGAAAWKDTHVRLKGIGAWGLQLVFLSDWEYAARESLSPNLFAPTNKESAIPEKTLSPVQIVSSGPNENTDAIHKLYFSAIAAATDRVRLASPYFVPDPAMMSALQTAALRGADVRVLVPKDGDVPLVAAAARSYYPELIAAGVKIYEFGPPVLHSKTLVVDQSVAVVGTANADFRSFFLNFEVVAAIYSAACCDRLSTEMEHDMSSAHLVTSTECRNAPFWSRLKSSAARTLSPML